MNKSKQIGKFKSFSLSLYFTLFTLIGFVESYTHYHARNYKITRLGEAYPSYLHPSSFFFSVVFVRPVLQSRCRGFHRICSAPANRSSCSTISVLVAVHLRLSPNFMCMESMWMLLQKPQFKTKIFQNKHQVLAKSHFS
jgi:hypothetical protein